MGIIRTVTVTLTNHNYTPTRWFGNKNIRNGFSKILFHFHFFFSIVYVVKMFGCWFVSVLGCAHLTTNHICYDTCYHRLRDSGKFTLQGKKQSQDAATFPLTMNLRFRWRWREIQGAGMQEVQLVIIFKSHANASSTQYCLNYVRWFYSSLRTSSSS